MKSRCPATQATSGHRLCITLYMIASKTMYEYMSFNKSWCVVGQSTFTLDEINAMEPDMCVRIGCHITSDSIPHTVLRTLQEPLLCTAVGGES
jgi:hypothetical protein